MKNRWTKIVTLVLSIAMILSVSIFPANVFAAEPSEAEQEAAAMSAYDPVLLKNLETASEQYSKLIGSFSQEPIPLATDYPDYFGGTYINDSGMLVVYVTPDFYVGEKLSFVKKEIFDIVGTGSIVFEPCKYSFKELTETMDLLNTIKLKDSESMLVSNFNTYMILDSENRIVVELDEYSEDYIKIFKKLVCNAGCIDFVETEKKPVDEINVNPGNKIGTNAGSGSVAYRVKKDGVIGIITAGHVANSTSPSTNSITFNGTTFAKCTKRQYSGSVDGAYCKVTNSSYTPTNTVGSGTLSTTCENPSAGSIVNKVGMKTGTTSGKIVSTNATVTTSGVTFTNLSTAKYSSDSGDSGGLVYTYYSSSGTRKTVGVHKGRGTNAFYTKASVLNSALGVSRY